MADPSSYRPEPGQIPDSPGVYRFRDEHRRVIYVGKAKSLRQRPGQLLPGPRDLHPRTPTMVTTAASVDWTVVVHRGRGAPARVLLDQGVRPPVQRPVPRRQELSLPRGDDGRGVPARPGHARPQEEGRALLRSLRPRVGDPRHRRPAAAGLPRPYLLRRRLQERRAHGRPCLLGYIGKCSAPCVGRVTPEEHRELAEDFCDFMAGRTGTYIRRLEKQMTAGRRGDGVREGGPAARRHGGAASGRWRRAPSSSPTPPTPTSSPSPRTSWRPPSRSSTSAAAGCAASAAGSPTRSRRSPPPSLVEHALQQLYGEETRRRRAQGGPGARAARARRSRSPQWLAERRGSM